MPDQNETPKPQEEQIPPFRGLYRHVKLGFDGYNKQRTKKYPKGQPNSVIARSINSGSTWRKKNPFIDRATRSSKAACEDKMAQIIESEIKKVMI